MLSHRVRLDIINNVREARDSLDRMADDFRIRNDRLAKPHSYSVGDSVLLSTKNVNLNLPCKKLSPAFVGPFTIRALLGTNAVQLNYSERFQLLNPRLGWFICSRLKKRRKPRVKLVTLKLGTRFLC
jgi:hypothetical protein